MNLAWLMRASRWARRPPSARMVVGVLCVVAACIALFAAERLIGWPAWLTPEDIGRVPR